MDDWNRLVGVWVSADERGKAGMQLLRRWGVGNGDKYVRRTYTSQYWLWGVLI